MCPLSIPAVGTKLQVVELVSWRQKGSQRTLIKNTDSGKRESCKATRNQGRRKFQKGGWDAFQKGGYDQKCYRRPSEIRTEKGSFNLAIMGPLEIEAGIMR